MKILAKVRSLFATKEMKPSKGGKETLCRKKIFLLGGIISFTVLLTTLFKAQDSSLLVIHFGARTMKAKNSNSHQQLADHGLGADKLGTQESEVVRDLLNSSASLASPSPDRKAHSLQKNPPSGKAAPIIYRAPLVVEREGVELIGGESLPIGTNLKGQLLTAIDTRETKQLYKVLLPEGGGDLRGGFISRGSLLFGHISYPGRGRKVFMSFSKALLPEGREVPIMAQALNAKDLSPGLVGDFHGKAKERVASTLGLTMLSAMTDTLTQKKGSGFHRDLTPKATLKNAFYQGVSQASEMEAKRQADQLANQPEYVTLPAGTEMIVNLLETYRGGKE